VEFVVAEVERRVYRLEGLKIDIELALLAVIVDYRSTVDDESIGRNLLY
jgi:hypothetical protein